MDATWESNIKWKKLDTSAPISHGFFAMRKIYVSTCLVDELDSFHNSGYKLSWMRTETNLIIRFNVDLLINLTQFSSSEKTLHAHDLLRLQYYWKQSTDSMKPI